MCVPAADRTDLNNSLLLAMILIVCGAQLETSEAVSLKPKHVAIAPDGQTYFLLSQKHKREHTVQLAKYTIEGQLAWERQFPRGTGKAVVTAVAPDCDGNVVVLGVVSRRSEESKCVIVKYSSSGDIVWQRHCRSHVGWQLSPIGFGIDAEGDLVLAGTVETTGQESELIHGASECQGTSTHESGLMIASYDRSGRLSWSWQTIKVKKEERLITDISLNQAGYSYILGYSLSNRRFSLVKFTPEGLFAWAQTWPPATVTPRVAIADIVTADGAGGCYVAGYCVGNDQLASMAIIRYAANGDPEWTALHSVGKDNVIFPLQLATDKRSVYVLSDRGPDAKGHGYPPSDLKDAIHHSQLVVLRYATDGRELWQAEYHAEKKPFAHESSIFVDRNGLCHVLSVTGTDKYMATAFDIDGKPIQEGELQNTSELVKYFATNGLRSMICGSDQLR